MVAPIRTTANWQDEFDTIIDVRSPSEFADDHIPGAINLPVLSDAERAEVGTIYKQVSPFEARKLGARLAAENIARHLKQGLGDHAKGWTPLIYCWRGGQRSGSMARILAEIGWVVSVLDGGYKSYRQAVIDGLTPLAEAIQPMLLQGPTGSAKTCILRAAASAGVQIIDLEDLAAHRGSLLGAEPDRQQPSQRLFESMLMQALQRIDPTRPVLIEAETSRIGSCHQPKGLWRQMINAPQIMIDAPVTARVDFLIRSYPHICADPGLLDKLINGMTRRHGHAICDGWRQLAESKDWQGLVTALINEHYDPAYAASGERRDGAVIERLEAVHLNDDDFERLAGQIASLLQK